VRTLTELSLQELQVLNIADTESKDDKKQGCYSISLPAGIDIVTKVYRYRKAEVEVTSLSCVSCDDMAYNISAQFY